MKKVFVLCVLSMFIFTACASMGPTPVSDTSIVTIVETNKGKEEAFDTSMRWVSQSFKSAKAVIEYSDKGSGTINCKGSITVPGNFGYPLALAFSLIIDIKDGKARLSYRFISTTVVVGSSSQTTTEIAPSTFQEFKTKTDGITKNYSDFLANSTTNW